MSTVHVPEELIAAALDRVLARALMGAEVSKTVREELGGKVREEVEKLHENFRDILEEKLEEILGRADSPGGLLERWLELYRDELMDRITDGVVTRLFSGPGGPSLFREEVLDSIAVQVIVGDGTTSEGC